MKGAIDLGWGCLGWAIIFVVARAGERIAFPNAETLRPLGLFEGAIISGCTAIVLLFVAKLRGSLFPVAIRFFAVLAVLCLSQSAWLSGVAPWLMANDQRLQAAARHPILFLFIEGAFPALIGAVTWLIFIGPSAVRRRIGLVTLSVIGCLAAAATVSPEVVRGTFEAAGLITLASPRHLSGGHTNPLARHVAYIAVAAITGLLFYLTGRQPVITSMNLFA